MKKRIAACILITCFIMTALLFAGCKKKPTQTDAEQNTPNPTENIDTAAEKPEAFVGEGSFFDDLDSFVCSWNINESGTVQEYLNCVRFKVTEVDKENMTSTLTVSLPQIADVLKKTTEASFEAGKDLPYDELLSRTQEAFDEALKTEELSYREASLTVPLQETEQGLKPVLDEQWAELILTELNSLYNECLIAWLEEMTNE